VAGALRVAGWCAAAVVSLVLHSIPGRAQALRIEGFLWGLGLKTAASLLKILVVHDWNGILALAAILALCTVLKRLFIWEQHRIGAAR